VYLMRGPTTHQVIVTGELMSVAFILEKSLDESDSI